MTPISNHYIGSTLQYKSTSRKFLDYDHNETGSFIPARYLRKDLKAPVSLLWKNDVTFENLLDEVMALRDDIECHFERRIQIFYQQLCLCYDSGIKLDIHKTKAQAGLKKTKEATLVPFAEAHCSTLPSLKAWTKDDDGVLFGERSYFSNCWNATTKLPRVVNSADSKIDFLTKFPGLEGRTFRGHCIKLLQCVCNGESRPNEALTDFLKQIASAIDVLTSGTKNEALLEVLGYYKAVAKRYEKFIQIPRNLSKILFEKKDYPVLQKRMWRQMQQEVAANEEIGEILDILGKVQLKRLVLCGILMDPQPKEEITIKQRKYAAFCCKNKKIAAMARAHAPQTDWKEAIEKLLKTKPKGIDSIIYLIASRFSPAHMQKFLHMNEGALDRLLAGKPTARKHITTFGNDPRIKALALGINEHLSVCLEDG